MTDYPTPSRDIASKPPTRVSRAGFALRAVTGERTISAGTRERFEIAYEVPQGATDLRLRYRGFTKIEEVAIH